MSDQENQDSQPKTGRQVALWLQRGRMQLAKQQAEEKPASAARNERVNENQGEEVIPPIRKIQIQAPTKRSVAAFLWMPQLNLSFQAFTFPIALLVQTFAQILCSTGLLAADHPARSFSGAKQYGIMQLLEEARQSLPPLHTLWGNGTRMLATRQYAIFASTIGVLITGGFTILTMFSQMFFGVSQAFAQPPYNPSLNFVTNGNLGLGYINAIFDPNGANVISAGLGQLFRMYSSAMLIFAGIIVLWIIIAAVAETARTGIPFGKQFNHVWAPIRLIVALGLLVPLGSGLNSGQHLVIYLTKWGAQQADQMWVEFATRSDSGSTTSSAVNSALSAIPVARDNYRSASDKMFDILLCQALWNQYVAANPIAGKAINPDAKSIKSSDSANLPASAQNLAIVTADGTVKKPDKAPPFQGDVVSWADGSAAGSMDCGSVGLPAMPVNPDSKKDPATKTQENILAAQAMQVFNFANGNAQSLANQVAAAALSAASANKPIENTDIDPLVFWDKYSGLGDEFAALRTQSIGQALKGYNRIMGKSFKDDAVKFGWISAPGWINKIAEQNGRVMEVASTLPTVTAPNVNSSGQNASHHIYPAWDLAMKFMADARATRPSEKPLQTDPVENAAKIAQESFSQILQPNPNPLGTIGSYGRKLMTEGLKMTFLSSVRDPENKSGDTSLSRAQDLIDKKYGIKRDANGNITDKGTLANLLAKVSDGGTLTPENSPSFMNEQIGNALNKQLGNLDASLMRPAGTMMISFGFMAGYILPLLPFFRFMLGVLGWILLLFEALLAVPLLAISLLKTDGEGFMTQNFQTGVVMILALIIRPILMIFGLLLGLLAFNGILNITNVSFMTAANPDNSLLSAVVYMVVYGILAYTLANSAFKAIDILPNQVMSWLGARLDQRVDDASTIHQQSAQMVGNLGMVSAMGGGLNVGKQGAGTTPQQSSPNSGGSGGFSGGPPGKTS